MNLSQFTLDSVPVNAKLYVYQTGTTTGATYYTDAAGTTVGTNPQPAPTGRFDPIYLDPAITYRIKVTDSTGGTTLYDVDPVRVLDEGTADGVLVVRSRAAAEKRTIPVTVNQVYCASYAAKGDRGQALYSRVASEPVHLGKFKSADNAWWELTENVLNPFMFGAKGDDNGTTGTNDSPAIQAMFDFIGFKGNMYPVNFMGAKYYVHDALLLPRLLVFHHLPIEGGGAILRTDQSITILSCRIPVNDDDAGTLINYNAFDISHLNFEGNNTTGQVGLHLIATYTSVIRCCDFAKLDYGSIGTFCLASAWRDNHYYSCAKRAAMVQSGYSYITNSAMWTGATTFNSASNISVIENCRVYGHASQTSAFGIFGSDAVRLIGCVSEGAGANYDVHFDYQSATTVKQFYVHMFHCEAPKGKLNFKVATTGKVVIDTVVLQYPAAFYDASGSVNCEVQIKGLSWLNALPTPNGLPYNAVTNPNPNGRWFYHGDGNGYGMATESTNRSSGTGFRFEDCVGSAYSVLSNPAHWEGGNLPYMLHVRGLLAADGGVQEWSSAPITFGTAITLPDGNGLGGFRVGNVAATTTSVPANSTVTETFTVTGLLYSKHYLFCDPYNAGQQPPVGIVWNAYITTNNQMCIRFTNVTGSALSMTSGVLWKYCALRNA